ncbi:MAG: glycosyltransferase [Bacteroidetes bacterium]|nr:MAG: glycosyltransferase [Bacteroidota bacterium]
MLIFIALCVSAGIYVLFQLWLAVGWWKPDTSPAADDAAGISVIVAAHNETENLRRFLPSLLKQSHPNYEVWVVLDRCTDGSRQVLEALKPTYPHLHWKELHATPPGWAPKKWAIHSGVAAARHELLAFTDADCQAESNWLKQVAAHFGPHTEVVLGLGLYFRQPGLLNLFIRFETFYTAFQYVGMARMGLPYMGVGRNLAYRRSFYVRHGGLQAFRGRLSGDDDLLVNAYAKARTTRVMRNPASFTFSLPKQSWKAWLSQKWRHLSASPAYSPQSKWLLATFHLAHACFYTGILVSLGLGLTMFPLFSLYLLRIMISWGIFISINQSIREKNLLYAYPFLDLLYFIYNLFVVPVGLIKQPEWKK